MARLGRLWAQLSVVNPSPSLEQALGIVTDIQDLRNPATKQIPPYKQLSYDVCPPDNLHPKPF